MTASDPQPVHDALYAAIRAELDDSLAFIGGCRQLRRRQRRPRVGPAVRDYLADQIAWTVIGMADDEAGVRRG